MSGYAKLFSRILDSTIWRENDPTRLLWITMLAMADKDGMVFSTVPGLADRARITLPECEKALKKFQQPDKYSWSKEEQGRRIKVVDGGWFLINHAKYRALMSADEQREKTRLRVQALRERRKSLPTVTPVTSNESNDIAKAYTEANTSGKRGGNVYSSSPPVDEQGNTTVNTPSPYKNPQTYTQGDFEERDQKLLARAKKEVLKRAAANVGNGAFTEAEFMTAVCEESGLTPQRVQKLEKLLKWEKS